MKMKTFTCLVVLLLALGLAAPAAFAADKPNILVIMSDDVGITNISDPSRIQSARGGSTRRAQY